MSGPREIEVAVLLELEGNFNVNAEARLVAIHLAMECIQSGSRHHCPVCAEIQRLQTRLVLRQWDAGTTRQSAVKAAVAIMAKYPNISGFIGPQYSGIAEAVADRVLVPGNGLDQLAVLSPSASNPALTKKPNFFRTTSSDVVVCQAIMQVAVNLRYKAIVGIVEASGGMPQGINTKMLELSSEFEVQYSTIQFTGTDFAGDLTEDLRRQNPAVILAVGKDTEDTYLLFQLLYNLRAQGVLSYRLLMGGDLVAGGGAPRFRNSTDDLKYFEGAVSFKASGSGERLEQWKRDWPNMVKELNLDTILTTEDLVQHEMPNEHLETPPSYCPETFEATILYAYAAALHPHLPMTSAIRLLPLDGFDCLDQQPVKLDQSGDRERNLVSIYRHLPEQTFVPGAIGVWSQTDSSIHLDPRSALDDLVNNPVVATTTALLVDSSFPGAVPLVVCIVIVVLLVAVLGFICCCPERLPLCLQRCLPGHLQPQESLTPRGGYRGDTGDGGEGGTGGGAQPQPVTIPPPQSQQVALPLPSNKTPGFQSTIVLGGDLPALLHVAVLAILACRAHKPIEVRLFTSRIKANLKFVQEHDRDGQVQTVHQNTLNYFARIRELADCFEQKDDSEYVWPNSCNLNITIIEDHVLGLLNKIKALNENVFKLVVEEYPSQFSDQCEEKRTAWETWFRSLLNPQIADAVVVSGEAGSLDHHEPQLVDEPQLAGRSEFALVITVRHGLPQPQKHNVLLTLNQVRVACNLASNVGTLTLQLTEAESSSIRVTPRASTWNKFESVDLLWAAMGRRGTVEGLLDDLHIVGSHVRDALHVFSLSTGDVKRIEHVRVTPAWAKCQASTQGSTPLVLLDKSAYTTHVLGRGFSCSIKAAFMSAVCLHLADKAGADTARRAELIASLEAFLQDDRDSEIRFFKDMLAPLPLIGYLDKVAEAGANLGGKDRLEQQREMLNSHSGVSANASQQDRSKAMNEVVKVLAQRCNLWKDLIPEYREQGDVRPELACSNGPLRRHTMRYEFAYSLQQAAFESEVKQTQQTGFTVTGLPLSFLHRPDASKTVETVFGEDPL